MCRRYCRLCAGEQWPAIGALHISNGHRRRAHIDDQFIARGVAGHVAGTVADTGHYIVAPSLSGVAAPRSKVQIAAGKVT